jgi:hypothetical protein
VTEVVSSRASSVSKKGGKVKEASSKRQATVETRSLMDALLILVLASISGYFTSFALLEAQAMFFFVYILSVMVVLPLLIKGRMSPIVSYIQAQAVVQLAVGLYWRFFLYGSYIEPSELKNVRGMGVIEIMSLGVSGMVQGGGGVEL